MIGAGVVGLAVARALRAQRTRGCHTGFGADHRNRTSSRNSEVIHAGIYYRPGSEKARLCLEGRRMLYEYCASRDVEHRRSGKLIVATDSSQVAELEAIHRNATGCGVDDLQWLDKTDIARIEPALNAYAALLSPSTGIIDSHGLMLALQGDAENAGAMIAFDARVVRGAVVNNGLELEVMTDGQPMRLRAKTVVNSAGLFAADVAAGIEGLLPEHVPPRYFAKGSYFTCTSSCTLFPSRLSGTRTWRARRAPDARPRRAGAVRAECRMDRCD